MSCTISDDISAFQYVAEKSINTQMLGNCRSWRIEIVIVSDQMFNKLHLHYIRIRSEILAVNVVIEKIFKDVLSNLFYVFLPAVAAIWGIQSWV